MKDGMKDKMKVSIFWLLNWDNN